MGFFSSKFRDLLGSPNQQQAAAALTNELDSLVAAISGLIEVQHNSDGTHNFQPSGFDVVPVGATIQWHAGVTTPAGWLLCNGANVSRTAYVLLFKKIGILYGAGDGVSTFTLPSLNGGTPQYIILACG